MTPTHPTQPPFFQLNAHDLQVVLFHMIIALAQTYLIGLGIEHPEWAPLVQTGSEFLRRLIV